MCPHTDTKFVQTGNQHDEPTGAITSLFFYPISPYLENLPGSIIQEQETRPVKFLNHPSLTLKAGKQDLPSVQVWPLSRQPYRFLKKAMKSLFPKTYTAAPSAYSSIWQSDMIFVSITVTPTNSINSVVT